MKSTSDSPPSMQRPSSIARVSMSTTATARSSLASRGMSGVESTGGVQPWETNDIRGDVAGGWRNRSINTESPPCDSMDNMSLDEDEGLVNQGEWGWNLQPETVQPVPPYYPLDPRSTRRVTLQSHKQVSEGVAMDVDGAKSSAVASHPITRVSRRISSACQNLSIYAHWDNAHPTAALVAMERVEMEITLYLGENENTSAKSNGPPSQLTVLVELQRRSGCTVTFHKYRRHLLNAAEGSFRPQQFDEVDGLDKPSGRDRTNQPRATLSGVKHPALTRPALSRPALSSSALSRPPSLSSRPAPSQRSPSFSADAASGPSFASLRPSESTSTSVQEKEQSDVEKALVALHIAADLIKKDRVDSRRLGMESLVLLTDPLRTGAETARIASRVVLLGTAREDPTVTSVDEGVEFDESAGLGIRETILELLMREDGKAVEVESSEALRETGSSESQVFAVIEREITDSLFNLCLTVLSNALNTLEGRPLPDTKPPSADDLSMNSTEGDGTLPSSGRRRAATEPAVSRRFIDGARSASGHDILSSLVSVLGQARRSPHDACQSARCLGVLFRGCGDRHRARARNDLDAKRIVAAALEVGARTHAKLEDASRVAMVALVTDNEEYDEGHSSVEEERMEEDEGTETSAGAATLDTNQGADAMEREEDERKLPSVLEQSRSEEEDGVKDEE